MNLTQIILLSVIGVAMVLSIIFMVMFLVEIARKSGNEDYEGEATDENASVFEYTEPVKKESKKESTTSNVTNINVMLASLDEQTKEEEKKEEKKEEKVEEPAPAQAPAPAPEPVAPVQTTVIIENGSVFDYKTRLEQIVASRDKVEKDLAKVEKAVVKYDRTKRRMARNQKMLDRRAGELTNLNLVMYSVTDIKNVDEDKKQKQEELTAHIAELKASIQDAEEFLESNKEKNEQNIKMAKFLHKEYARMNDEVGQLEELIRKAEEAEAKKGKK